jgi:uncharacterized membrane protein YeaQ/YmgE (transglycosylase-associated protein family)
VGALTGWLATRFMNAPARSAQIENVLIGMFGAFIGGEFVAAQLSGAQVANSFHISSLLLAIVGAVVLLLLLYALRKLMGPMHKSRSSNKKRDY